MDFEVERYVSTSSSKNRTSLPRVQRPVRLNPEFNDQYISTPSSTTSTSNPEFNDQYISTPNSTTSLTMTFTCLMGAPVIFVADRIVEKLGRQVVFVLSFIAFTIRMFGYSFLTNPWYSYVFEAFEVWTNQVMWVAAVTYFAILAPASLLATLAGIAGSVHFNIGLGGGAFTGGLLITHIGMVWTFRTFGIASFFFAIMYIIIQKMYLNKAFVSKAQADISASTTVMTA